MHLIQVIGQALDSVSAQAAIVAVVVEFVLRLIKSPKPLSILYGLALICHSLGAVLGKAGDVLDKILPQRLAG